MVSRLAVCGSMRVCDTSLEPSWTPYERMIGRFCAARAARPQYAKMRFLLHKAALNGRFKARIAHNDRFETLTLKKSVKAS